MLGVQQSYIVCVQHSALQRHMVAVIDRHHIPYSGVYAVGAEIRSRRIVRSDSGYCIHQTVVCLPFFADDIA